jgi:hypothetical protein
MLTTSTTHLISLDSKIVIITDENTSIHIQTHSLSMSYKDISKVQKMFNSEELGVSDKNKY